MLCFFSWNFGCFSQSWCQRGHLLDLGRLARPSPIPYLHQPPPWFTDFPKPQIIRPNSAHLSLTAVTDLQRRPHCYWPQTMYSEKLPESVNLGELMRFQEPVPIKFHPVEASLLNSWNNFTEFYSTQPWQSSFCLWGGILGILKSKDSQLLCFLWDIPIERVHSKHIRQWNWAQKVQTLDFGWSFI